ncbi:hypothetical protein BDP27DRAFT_1425054 [Rhodocollybia butyracea]|uniref:Protection of telomeres protein 1 ssDNA-binding domain-containing protein n=1 Tax=Rhodocollybia butyracea TaxID=206335 RepID=A0A9P5PNP9_9AGAR|nr:hypothetical protein BDP27DRAFT_1425054 [Rhodocollybia butyracea]
MKRDHTQEYPEQPRKKQRTQDLTANADLFDFPEHQENLASVFQATVHGYIVGMVLMVFWREDNISLVMSVEDWEAEGGKVEVVFAKSCSTKLRDRKIEFLPKDRLFLSLQGCAGGSNGKMIYDGKVLLKIVPNDGALEVVVDDWGVEGFRPWTSFEAEWVEPPMIPESKSLMTPDIPKSVKGPPSFQAGCCCDTLSLSSLAQIKPKGCYTIAAVVCTGSMMTMSRNGDHTISLHLVDPSNRKPSDMTKGFTTANCFARTKRERLPHSGANGVEAGDIIVLYDMKAVDFNGSTNLVGYKDRFKWSLFDVDFIHGPNAPRKHDQKLLDYCSKLGEWWKDIQGVIVKPTRRPTLLIKDATPHTESSGYFDCIAEVVHKYKPTQPCYSLYVTDYTSSDGLAFYESEWCPPGLSSSILKIELWDKSSSLGPSMEIGGIYAFKNIRMRVANNGNYEGKMHEMRITKLDPTRDTALHELVNRRTRWATKYKLEFRRIEQVGLGEVFNCVAEILNVVMKKSGTVKLYATDYTSNELLPDAGLGKCIFEMRLQADEYKKLTPGQTCLIQNVVMSGDGLGGTGKSISLLDRELSSNRLLIEGLERRKMEIRASCTSIKELVSRSEPTVPFSIVARATIIKPCKLRDFCRGFCENCKRFVSHKACVACNNIKLSYKYQFKVWIVEAGSKHPGMAIEVCDDALFLKDMPRVDLSQDKVALGKCQSWFQSFAGNLLEYQLNDGKGVLNTPLIGFEGYRYIREEDGKKINRVVSIKY